MKPNQRATVITLLERNTRLHLPIPYQLLLTSFIFATLGLGEISEFCWRYWWWDMALHTMSGMILGLVAFLILFTLFDCDRVRITADGQFRTCLFATTEFDLRALLRNGATDEELAAEIRRAVGTKWAGHNIGNVAFVRPRRTMSQIGG